VYFRAVIIKDIILSGKLRLTFSLCGVTPCCRIGCVYCVSTNVPPLACYNFERILIFFGRNVADKVGNQKTLYCGTSSNLCFWTTCQNEETRKLQFHTNAVLVESTVAVGLCCMHNAPVHCLPVICDVFDSI